MNTRMKITMSIESTLPTSIYQTAEKLLINRLRSALKHCTTLEELEHYFKGGNNEFDYIVQNEAV